MALLNRGSGGGVIRSLASRLKRVTCPECGNVETRSEIECEWRCDCKCLVYIKDGTVIESSQRYHSRLEEVRIAAIERRRVVEEAEKREREAEERRIRGICVGDEFDVGHQRFWIRSDNGKMLSCTKRIAWNQIFKQFEPAIGRGMICFVDQNGIQMLLDKEKNRFNNFIGFAEDEAFKIGLEVTAPATWKMKIIKVYEKHAVATLVSPLV